MSSQPGMSSGFPADLPVGLRSQLSAGSVKLEVRFPLTTALSCGQGSTPHRATEASRPNIRYENPRN